MFARLFGWLRRHQRIVDFAFMLPLAAFAVLVRSEYAELQDGRYLREVALLPHLALTAGACLPLIWRRRWPRTVFAVISLVTLVQWLAGINISIFDFSVLVAMYTVAAQCVFQWAAAALLVAEAGIVMGVYRERTGQHAPADWRVMMPYTIVVGAIWVCGLYISTRRKYLLGLEERAKRLERERDAQAEVAAAAERARIAREMHDVIAHSISVMVVQADGAAWTLGTDVVRARRAMEAIGATGRQALTEMRRMLGVLREDGAASLTPQPGVAQLPELVEQIRSAGSPVELAIHGTPVPVPTGLELVVYRIVQEALTNVLKHAGPRASAWVDLHYGDQTIEVRIRDDGRGATFSDGRGHGLVGMRERAAVYGGTVRAAPAPGGGFQVIAWLPVKEVVKA